MQTIDDKLSVRFSFPVKGLVVLRPEGDINANNLKDFGEYLLGCHSSLDLLIDMQGVKGFDNGAFSFFIEAWKNARDRGTLVDACGVKGGNGPYRAFQVTSSYEFFPSWRGTEEQALELYDSRKAVREHETGEVQYEMPGYKLAS